MIFLLLLVIDISCADNGFVMGPPEVRNMELRFMYKEKSFDVSHLRNFVSDLKDDLKMVNTLKSSDIVLDAEAKRHDGFKDLPRFYEKYFLKVSAKKSRLHHKCSKMHMELPEVLIITWILVVQKL